MGSTASFNTLSGFSKFGDSFLLSNSLFSLVTQWKYGILFILFYTFHMLTSYYSSTVTSGPCSTRSGKAASTVFLSEVLHATLQIENKSCASGPSWSFYGSLAGLSLGKGKLLGVDLRWIALSSTASNGNWQGHISASSTSLFPKGRTNFVLYLKSNAPSFITQAVGTVMYSDTGMISLANLAINFDPKTLSSNDGMLVIVSSNSY